MSATEITLMLLAAVALAWVLVTVLIELADDDTDL